MKLPKKLLHQILPPLIFLILSAELVLLFRAKISSYIQQMQIVTSQVSGVGAETATTEGMLQLQGVITSLKPIMFKISLLTYFLLPLAIFLLWALALGISFYYSSEKPKKNLKGYLVTFTLISAVPFLTALYLGVKLIQSVANLFLGSVGVFPVIIYSLIILLITYHMAIILSLLEKNPWKKCLKKTFKISWKKAHKMVPFFLLFVLVMVAMLSTLFSLYMNMFPVGLGTVIRSLLFVVGVTLAILMRNNLKKIILKNVH